MPNNSGENHYFEEVKNILNDTPRHVVIDDFNPEIWKTVLRTDNTDIVCIPSLMDPFPHTSIEAKLFNVGMSYVTVISDVDGAVDAFTKDEAVYVDPRNTESFAGELIGIANLSRSERGKIVDRNKSSFKNFDFPEIFKNFIARNLK
jgi:hypothetical protein